MQLANVSLVLLSSLILIIDKDAIFEFLLNIQCQYIV